MARKSDNAEQVERFKETARALGCDEDEAAFDQALKKVAESGPAPKHEPKKRGPGGAKDGSRKSGK